MPATKPPAARAALGADIRKAKRGGRVCVDVLQIARGRHVVPPYVLRPVSGATVSTPLRRTELTPALDPRRSTLRTVPTRLARLKTDPMASLVGKKFGRGSKPMNADQRSRAECRSAGLGIGP